MKTLTRNVIKLQKARLIIFPTLVKMFRRIQQSFYRMKRSRHGDDVNGDVDVAKTGDTSSLHCRFSVVVKALTALHEQGFIPVFNYDLRKCVNAYCIPMIMYHFLPSFLSLMPVTCKRHRFD